MADRTFLLKVIGDVSGASKALGTLDDDAKKADSSFGSVAKTIGGIAAVGIGISFGKSMVNAASEQEQAWGAVDSVFGEYADSIHAFGDDAAQNLGLAQSEFEQLGTLTGALLKNAGVPLDEVAQSTKDLTQVGADLSAMYGGTVADSMNAINSALKGEMDPLEAFGVSLKATAIEAKAVAMGLVDSEGKATDYGKKMATIALIQEQAADSAGTFAKESDSMAGQTQILSAQFKDLQADLGTRLLPVVVQVAAVLKDLLTFVANNTSWLIPLAAAIGTVVVALKAWTLAMEVYKAATQAAELVQKIFNSTLLSNPIFLAVVAIAALTAGLIWAYKNVDWFRELVDKSAAAIVDAFEWVVDAVKEVWEAIKFAYDWVKDNWPLILAIITGPIGLAVYAIVRYWDDIRNGVRTLIENIRQFFAELPGKLATALSNIWSTVTDPFVRAFDWVRARGDDLLNWFFNLPGNISNAFAYLADAIYGPFEEAFNAIRRIWNQTAGGFGFSIPGWVPGVGGKSFRIPEMAAGGIVNKPTVALIGEAGPEAVVPLSRGAGFGNVTINVFALTANAEVGRKVWEALREYERSSGQTFSAA